MRQTTTMCALILLNALATYGFAKGLDEIQPRTEQEKSAAQPPTGEVPTTETPAPQAEAADKPATPATVERSASSLKLEDKLSIGLSYGLVTIPKAKLGEFSAFGGADIHAQWRFHKSSNGKHSTAVTLRYLPIDAETRIEGQSYHAMIESYFLGTTYGWHTTQSLSVLLGIELGYLLVYMDSQDRFPVTEAAETNEFAYGATTGLDWQAMQKLKVGPRVNVAFGKYQILQYAAALSFTF